MPHRSMDKFARMPVIGLATIEFAGLVAAFYVGSAVLYGRLPTNDDVGGSVLGRAVIIATVMLLAMIAMGLYQLNHRLNLKEILTRLAVSMALGVILLVVLYSLMPGLSIPPTQGVTSLAVSASLLTIIRVSFWYNIDDNIFRYRTLVYGAGKRAECINSLRRRADRRGFRIVGTIAAPGDVCGATEDVVELNGRSLAQVASDRCADEIVVAMDNRRGSLPTKDLLHCKLRGTDVIDIVEFMERESEKIRIDLVQPGWLIFSEGFQSNWLNRFCKRTVDLIVSLIVLIVAFPIIILVAISIKIEDGFRQPVLYRQIRVGKFGIPFVLLKFRSMQVDAEPDGKAIWAAKEDSRVTWVGRIIRLSRLDELPQLINIIRGQMSLVGPRPERPQFVAELAEKIPYYNERHTTKPGLTGWAQLKYSYGASVDDAVEKFQYDLYYLKNQNLLFDLVILLQTVEVVLWSKGAR